MTLRLELETTVNQTWTVVTAATSHSTSLFVCVGVDSFYCSAAISSLLIFKLENQREGQRESMIVVKALSAYGAPLYSSYPNGKMGKMNRRVM